MVYSFRARAGRSMTFPSVGGAWTCSPSVPEYGADGTSTGCFQPEGQNINGPGGPFSAYHLTDFEGALAGVFLEDSLPASLPPALRFYVNDASQGGIQTGFKTLSPLIGRVFFIGDGLTGTGIGSVQGFRVPPATHLYLGYVDSCNGGPVPGCYSDNVGSLIAVVRMQDYQLNWVEPRVTSAPSVRCCVGMTYDAATRSTVLFGGGNGGITPGVRYADTWTWTNRWTQQSPAASPSARQGPGMAYDPTTGTVVLFGGGNSSGTKLGDTWTWDGVTWTQQFPPVSPPAREWGIPGMAYDPVTGTVLLFGGLGANSALADTWEWDGRKKTWTQKFPASSPAPRRGMLAYDAAQKDIVLFGGDNGAGDCCNTYYNDTWTWDGVTWTQQFPASSPSARADAAIAYDANLSQVVLIGGFSTPGQGLTGTWMWNGSTWTEIQTADQPSGLWAAGIDFDPLSNGVVLFGEEITGDPFVNNTWLFAPAPVR